MCCCKTLNCVTRHRDVTDDGEVAGPRRCYQSTTPAVDGHRQSAGEDAHERVTGAQGRTRSASATDQPLSVGQRAPDFLRLTLLELTYLYYNVAGHLFRYVTNQPPKANSAFHPSGVGK